MDHTIRGIFCSVWTLTAHHILLFNQRPNKAHYAGGMNAVADASKKSLHSLLQFLFQKSIYM